jgi:hypothetical protein
VRPVLSERAELASNRVMTTLAVGASSSLLELASGARLAGTEVVLLADPRHFLVLPHITAVAEQFSHALLIEASERQIDLTHPFRLELWKKAEQQAEGAWPEHIEAWKRWHNVRLRECPMFSRFDAFVEARNAIMHGLGNLTRRQLRKDGGRSLKEQLAKVGIQVQGTRLVVTPSSVKLSAEVSRDFIAWLDQAVRVAGVSL